MKQELESKQSKDNNYVIQTLGKKTYPEELRHRFGETLLHQV